MNFRQTYNSQFGRTTLIGEMEVFFGEECEIGIQNSEFRIQNLEL